ncbi:MAG: RNase adapter RapZ, partial [Myxococcota bacterium]
KVAFISFGFKHGLPLEADTVLDVRFLPNPYFEPSMRELTGQDPAVSEYVVKSPHGARFIDETDRLLEFLVPRFQAEGRRYLTVAIGCTGGQHRSVAIAHALARRLEQRGTAVDLRHRDMPGDAS